MIDKIMNEEPIKFNDYNLTFIASKYQFGNGLAIIAKDDEDIYAVVSINLVDYGYYTKSNEIYLNHDLPKDFKEMFCENFCDCGLDSCEKVKFGPYSTTSEKVVILDKYLR